MEDLISDADQAENEVKWVPYTRPQDSYENDKAPGIDSIHTAMLKVHISTSTSALRDPLINIWNTANILND